MPLAGQGRYSIRPAVVADVDALAEIEQIAFDPAHYGGTLMSRRSFLHHVREGRNALLVAVDEDDGSVAGYALGMVKQGSPYVRFYSLAIFPRHNGRGAGTLLFEAIEDYARDHGYRGVRLEVREDNDRLIRRYLRLGYRIFATVADYYADGAGATRMVRDFASGAGNIGVGPNPV